MKTLGKKTLRFLAAAMILTAVPALEGIHAQGLGGDGGRTTGGSSDRTVLEGIAAIVGDKVILVSDVIQRMALVKQSTPSLGLSETQLYQEILDDLIANNLLLVRAEEDSIPVSDDIINAQLDERIDQLVQQAGSQSALEQYYGKSIAEIRTEARPIIRDQLMVEFLRRQHFGDLKVTERDMEEFYRQYRDSLPEIPEQVEIARILILEKPDTQAKERTMILAQSIIDSLKNGGDFAEFARRYSVDPSSAAHGGEVGWVKNGRFVKEYEDAARALNINEYAPPIETKFGIHVIQLLDKRPDELRSRHILLPLKADDSQKQAIIDTLNSIRSRALAGESFAGLAARYSDDEDSKYNGGIIAKYPTSELPASYKWIPDSLTIGGISDPRPTRPSPTEAGYHIIKLNRIVPPHMMSLKEDREQLEQLATSWKQNQKLREWIDELRKEIYWEVKYDFK